MQEKLHTPKKIQVKLHQMTLKRIYQQKDLLLLEGLDDHLGSKSKKYFDVNG